MRRRLLIQSALALPAFNSAAWAQGSTWPTQPIRLIVPFAPGGGSDLVAQAIAPRMQSALGQRVNIEHHPGRSGATGAIMAMQAPPDGHTLVIGQSGVWSINHLLTPNVGYDPIADFTAITIANATPNVLAVNPRQVEAEDLIALMLWLKRPGFRARYTSAGIGLADHLAMELFKQSLRVEMEHVPQNGAGPSIAAVVAGTQAQLAFIALGTAAAPIREARVRPIMITSQRRSPLLPDVPTSLESGHRNFVVETWQGIMAPANLPDPVRTRVHEAVVAALRIPEVTQGMESRGFTVLANTPQQALALQRREISRWRGVIQAAGLASGG